MNPHDALHRHRQHPLAQALARLEQFLSTTRRAIKARLVPFLSRTYRATRTRAARLAGRAYQQAKTITVKWVARLPVKEIARVLREPARVLGGAAMGMLYGPMTAIILGIVGTLLPGIVKGYADLPTAGAQVVLGTVIVTPIVAFSLGLVALGIGGIVGAINAAADGGIAMGLEWALVAGLGAGMGLGIRFADLEIALLGLAGSGLIGGSVGFLTWLSCTSKRRQPLDAERAIGYTVGLVLIAAFVPVIIG
jgi:hypothetical protein